jgi:Calx-beta domain-containing protein
MASLAAIGYASGRGLGVLGYGYGYGYEYCTLPAEYCSSSTSTSTPTTTSTSTSTTTPTSTSTSSSSTTTTSSSTTTTSSTTSTSTTSTSTTTTSPKPGKGCGDKNHVHEREFQCKIKIHDAGSVKEGKKGFTIFVFEVSINDKPIDRLSVEFSTANGTATAGSDYVATSGVLVFPSGLPAKKRFVQVKVKGDKVPELNETFFVNLSNASANAVIDDPQGQGTIKNDD